MCWSLDKELSTVAKGGRHKKRVEAELQDLDGLLRCGGVRVCFLPQFIPKYLELGSMKFNDVCFFV